MKPPVTSPSVRDEDEKLVSDRIASLEAGVAALRTQRAEVGCSRTAETMLAAAAVTMTVTVTMVTTMVRTTLLCGSHHPENEAEGPPLWAYHTTSSFSVSGSRVRGKSSIGVRCRGTELHLCSVPARGLRGRGDEALSRVSVRRV